MIELKCKMMTKRTSFEETFDFPPSAYFDSKLILVIPKLM